MTKCGSCGMEFFRVPFFKQKYCSYECFGKMNAGENHYKWKGYKVTGGGYVKIFQGDEHPFTDSAGYVFEHRLNVESHLRKTDPTSKFLVEVKGNLFLSPTAVVHHKDRNKQNNDISNLEPFSSHSEHLSSHNHRTKH